MVPRFGRHGGGHSQPALRIESYNHGGEFPRPIKSVNLGGSAEPLANCGFKIQILIRSKSQPVKEDDERKISNETATDKQNNWGLVLIPVGVCPGICPDGSAAVLE